MQPLTMETAGELAVKTPWKFFLHEDFDLYATEAPEVVKLAEEHFVTRMKSIITQRMRVVHGEQAAAFVLTRPYRPLPAVDAVRDALRWIGRLQELVLLVPEGNDHATSGREFDLLCCSRSANVPLVCWRFEPHLARRCSVETALVAKAEALDEDASHYQFWLRFSAVLEQVWPWQALVPPAPQLPPPPAPASATEQPISIQPSVAGYRDYMDRTTLRRQMTMSLAEFAQRYRAE